MAPRVKKQIFIMILWQKLPFFMTFLWHFNHFLWLFYDISTKFHPYFMTFLWYFDNISKTKAAEGGATPWQCSCYRYQAVFYYSDWQWLLSWCHRWHDIMLMSSSLTTNHVRASSFIKIRSSRNRITVTSSWQHSIMLVNTGWLSAISSLVNIGYKPY